MSRWDEDFGFDEFDDESGEGFDGDPSGFVENELTAEQQYLDELADALGLDSIAQIVVNFEDMVTQDNLRGDRFTTLTDAIDFLASIGVLGFSSVVYFEDEDLWGVDVPDDSG